MDPVAVAVTVAATATATAASFFDAPQLKAGLPLFRRR
jgi:hypothetical protein